ncbi:glycoside hydrolase family 9 protein [Kribbella sp. NPDC023855]|uniref:glycoside hydrolase family 9 protein n=1 Tax=Kribbella sp. NPDC023855 TaxID=3154698 RepID=UPI0033EA4073
MGWPVWALGDVLAGRPAVRVNQCGYQPGRPMAATVVHPAEQPLAFVLRNGGGQVVFEGWSDPWPVRPEPTSGQSVHVLDFSATRHRGDAFRLEVGGMQSHPFRIGNVPYRQLGADALRVLTLLRSGTPVADPVYGRPAGHLGVLPNRGDIAVPAWTGPEAERLYPGWRCEGRFDVSGGWYDAGDYGKYVTSGAIALWQLLRTLDLLAALEVDDPTLQAGLLDECRWQLDWVLRMQVPSPDPLAGMAFHRVHGTEWSPLPGWAHEDPTERVLHRPSTSATLHLAATAAQGARLFRATDSAYADRLLTAARRAHVAAHEHPELFAPDDHAKFGGGPYGDSEHGDDFYWAAVQLWLATGDSQYREEVLNSPWHLTTIHFDGFDYDRVAVPAQLDLALLGQALPGHDQVASNVVEAADGLLDLQARQPWGNPYAPSDGWAWGSNGRLLNNLVVLVAADLLTGERRFADGVSTGMDYLFGRNALGQSYVTGYGIDDTRHQRTRQFGHDLDPAFPPPPPGALAGGANSQPSPDFPYDARLLGQPPQCCYLDEPTSEVTNDICIRWNTPLVHIATYLAHTQPD